MIRTTVAEARREDSVGKDVILQGWVRTRRDSKGGFSFLEINDGSSFKGIQVIADSSLPNYATEIARANTGASIEIHGKLVESKGQRRRRIGHNIARATDAGRFGVNHIDSK